MFSVIGYPNEFPDQMDEAIKIYRKRDVRVLAIRILEKNSNQMLEKLHLQDMLEIWMSLGMDPDSLEEDPISISALDSPGVIVVYNIKQSVPFPATVQCVNFDLENRNPNYSNIDKILIKLKCSIVFVLKN